MTHDSLEWVLYGEDTQKYLNKNPTFMFSVDTKDKSGRRRRILT